MIPTRNYRESTPSYSSMNPSRNYRESTPSYSSMNPSRNYRESTPSYSSMNPSRDYRESTPSYSSMNPARDYRESTPSYSSSSGCNGVCIMSTTWRDEQHPSFINFIRSFLDENSFKLNFVPIAPDFIFNCGGLSVAFIFATNWDFKNTESIFSRIHKLRGQFANFYVVVTLPTKDQNDSFIRSYFKYGMEFGKPTFIPVQDLEMGFEKIVKIAHARGVCKRQDAIAKLRDEREKSVQSMDAYIKVVTSIPGIDSHDANALHQAIGSIEAIAKASKEYILENTDLSVEKAETITRFFRDPKYYLGPKIR